MKKIALISVLFLSLANASSEPIKEKQELSPEERMIYMPDIITPEELKSGIYGGLGLSLSSLSSNGSTSLFSAKKGNNRMIDLAVLAGYNINKYLSAETRALISTAYDDSIDFKSWGVYLKPQYEVYKDVKIYSLIGYGTLDASQTTQEGTKVSSAVAQVGVGADYKLGKNFKLFADYLYMGEDSNALYKNKKTTMKSSAITTGITYDF
jgi:predicted porin